LNKVEPRPDFAITGGDLIMDALLPDLDRAKLEWNLFQECMQALEMKAYYTIGNHDIVGWAAKAKVPEDNAHYGKHMFAERVGEGKTYRSFDHNGWHFVLLDSIVQDPETKEYKGWIDEAQLAWLQADLQKTGKHTPVILVTHIPFYSVWHQHLYGPETKLSPKSLVGNTFRFRQLLELYNVKLVLSGHGHIVEKIAFGKISYIQGGAVSGLWWRGPVHGTPECYGIITCHPNGDFAYEFHEYGWKARKM
jgi:3',5'-cyclic-AMP phosphodiesterase